MSKGYLYWEAEFYRGLPYLGGYTLSRKFSRGFSWTDSAGIFVLPTHGGTAITQRPFLGENRPLELVAAEFRIPRAAVDEEDWFLIRRVKASGASALFVPYLWTEEVLDVVSGENYLLGRSVAWGIATGVSSATHPARYFLDDSEDPSAATISGQTLTALATGRLAVRYMPAFRVVVDSISHTVQDVNDLQSPLALTEVLEIP